MRTQATFDEITLPITGLAGECRQLGSQYCNRLGDRASKIPNKTAAVVRVVRKMKAELADENAT
jgi:hypothetical protein